MTVLFLTAKSVARLRQEAKASDKRFEVRDDKQNNIVLRGGPSGLQWQARFYRKKSHRLTLGLIDEWSIAEARELGMRIAIAVKGGQPIPDATWLQAQRVAYGKIEAPPPGELPPTAVGSRSWTFATAREKYLEHVARVRRAATWDDYRNMLNMKQLRSLERRPVSQITRRELSELIAAIHATGTERHADHLARVIRPMWTWLAQDTQIGHAMIVPGTMVGLRAPEPTLREDETAGNYVPAMQEMGRILAIARTDVLHPLIASALELTAYTCQRRRTIITARKKDFKEDPLGGLWLIPARFRKNGLIVLRNHVIPLPPQAWAVVRRALEASHAPDSEWLFPQFRPSRAGAPMSHMSGSTLNHALLAMPEIQASPHDFRRAFATHGEAKFGLRRKDTQAILDHGEGEEGSDVTRTHYALHDGTHHKWPTMQNWCDHLEAAISVAIVEDPRLVDGGWLTSEMARGRYGDRSSTPL